MKVVERIKEPIYEEMELFEKKFSKLMSSHISLLNRITHFIVNRKGKQMRPMFVFLVAKMMGNGKLNERSFKFDPKYNYHHAQQFLYLLGCDSEKFFRYEQNDNFLA